MVQHDRLEARALAALQRSDIVVAHEREHVSCPKHGRMLRDASHSRRHDSKSRSPRSAANRARDDPRLLKYRGRDASFLAPPAQIRTCRITAYGSYLDGEAISGPGVKDTRLREKVGRQLSRSFPRHAISLAAPPERASPEIGDVRVERAQCSTICWHGMVHEEARGDLP